MPKKKSKNKKSETGYTEYDPEFAESQKAKAKSKKAKTKGKKPQAHQDTEEGYSITDAKIADPENAELYEERSVKRTRAADGQTEPEAKGRFSLPNPFRAFIRFMWGSSSKITKSSEFKQPETRKQSVGTKFTSRIKSAYINLISAFGFNKKKAKKAADTLEKNLENNLEGIEKKPVAGAVTQLENAVGKAVEHSLKELGKGNDPKAKQEAEVIKKEEIKKEEVSESKVSAPSSSKKVIESSAPDVPPPKPPATPPPASSVAEQSAAPNQATGATQTKPPIDPKFEKYVRMHNAGLPEGAVRNAMERDGVYDNAGIEFLQGLTTSKQNTEVAKEQPKQGVSPAEQEVAPPPEIDPKLAKYAIMSKAGLAEGAVKQKMDIEGVSDEDQKTVLNHLAAIKEYNNKLGGSQKTVEGTTAGVIEGLSPEQQKLLEDLAPEYQRLVKIGMPLDAVLQRKARDELAQNKQSGQDNQFSGVKLRKVEQGQQASQPTQEEEPTSLIGQIEAAAKKREERQGEISSEGIDAKIKENQAQPKAEIPKDKTKFAQTEEQKEYEAHNKEIKDGVLSRRTAIDGGESDSEDEYDSNAEWDDDDLEEEIGKQPISKYEQNKAAKAAKASLDRAGSSSSLGSATSASTDMSSDSTSSSPINKTMQFTTEDSRKRSQEALDSEKPAAQPSKEASTQATNHEGGLFGRFLDAMRVASEPDIKEQANMLDVLLRNKDKLDKLFLNPDAPPSVAIQLKFVSAVVQALGDKFIKDEFDEVEVKTPLTKDELDLLQLAHKKVQGKPFTTEETARLSELEKTLAKTHKPKPTGMGT